MVTRVSKVRQEIPDDKGLMDQLEIKGIMEHKAQQD